jgi:hypothetical protein
VVDVKHGRSKIARLLPLFLLLLPAGSLAQNIDVVFHWAPSPLVDEGGNIYSPAVEYMVYRQRDGGQIQLVMTVKDTTATVSLEPGFTHRIRVCGVDASQRIGLLSEWSDDLYIDPDIPQIGDQVPIIPGLQPSYPNPFNPETTIVYGVPEGSGAGANVSLEIYNVVGHRIRTLQPVREPGWHSVKWNGTDDAGRVQPTGQYIVRFACNGQVRTTKMMMVK